jgi:hypothetical protein
MTSYKGVRVLDDFNDVDFLVWKPLALGHFETYHPQTAALVLKMQNKSKLTLFGALATTQP